MRERARSAPSSPSDLTSSLTREREENQRLKEALRAAESAIIDEIAIADQRNEEYRRKDKTYDQAFFAGYGNGLGYARRMIIDALTSGASAEQETENTNHMAAAPRLSTCPEHENPDECTVFCYQSPDAA